MIQLKTNKKSGYELTDRKRVVTLEDERVLLEEHVFESPGEYEVEGIEVVYGEQAALIVWEKLQVAYIFRADKVGQFEKSQFTPCNVVIFAESLTGLEKSQVNEILETYDPNVVVVSNRSASSEIKGAYKFEERDGLKLTDQTLPTEGRDFVVLV